MINSKYNIHIFPVITDQRGFSKIKISLNLKISAQVDYLELELQLYDMTRFPYAVGTLTQAYSVSTAEAHLTGEQVLPKPLAGQKPHCLLMETTGKHHRIVRALLKHTLGLLETNMKSVCEPVGTSQWNLNYCY